MPRTHEQLEQALKDLVEAFTELEAEAERESGDDEDAYSHFVTEILETSIESALEEFDVSTTSFATMLSHLTDGLEQLDPAAFEDESDNDEYKMDENGLDIDDDVEEYEEIDEDDDDDDELD